MLAQTDDRGYSWVADKLRAEILAGNPATGQSLAPIRTLAEKYGVSYETVRRAMKRLEVEGMLVSMPSHGYRVQAKANDPSSGLPVAVVLTGPRTHDFWNQTVMSSLQTAASERDWPLLAIPGSGRPHEISKHLQASRCSGLILSSMDPALLKSVKQMGLATVLVDSWDPQMELDAVVQDSFQGALVAAEYLIQKGHRRIAWLGPIGQSVQSKERFGGAYAALHAAGLTGQSDFFLDTSLEEIPNVARALLTRPDRPTAVLALWGYVASILISVANELNLRAGKDFEMVSWLAKDLYQVTSVTQQNAGYVPPTMVWSTHDLAEAAFDRLAERRNRMSMPQVQIKIPVTLQLQS